MAQITIDNCKFGNKCTQQWMGLEDQGKNNVRYCPKCDENVHWCNTMEELENAIEKQWCVAFNACDPSEENDDCIQTWVGGMSDGSAEGIQEK